MHWLLPSDPLNLSSWSWRFSSSQRLQWPEVAPKLEQVKSKSKIVANCTIVASVCFFSKKYKTREEADLVVKSGFRPFWSRDKQSSVVIVVLQWETDSLINVFVKTWDLHFFLNYGVGFSENRLPPKSTGLIIFPMKIAINWIPTHPTFFWANTLLYHIPSISTLVPQHPLSRYNPYKIPLWNPFYV